MTQICCPCYDLQNIHHLGCLDLSLPCVLTISKMLRVPETTDIKLQEEPCEEGRGGEWTERRSQLGGFHYRPKADCQQIACSYRKLGQDPKLCHGNIKMGPRVI